MTGSKQGCPPKEFGGLKSFKIARGFYQRVIDLLTKLQFCFCSVVAEKGKFIGPGADLGMRNTLKEFSLLFGDAPSVHFLHQETSGCAGWQL